MRCTCIAAIVLALSATSFGGWEKDMLNMPGNLHGSLSLTYDTSYIWRGFDVFPDDKPAWHAGLDLDLFQTGLGASVVMHRAIDESDSIMTPEGEIDFANLARMDYTLYYQGGLFGGEQYATNYRVGWVYYNYPSNAPERFDLQEGQAIISMPNLLPVKGLIPTYVLVKLWPATHDSIVGHWVPNGDASASGWAHIFMLDYGFTVPGIIPQIPEHLIKLHSEVVYNDGVHPFGGRMDHDWSDAVFGVSTDLNLSHGFTLTPGVFYQISMESKVNDENETWGSLSLKFAF